MVWGSFAATAQGSHNEPRLIVLRATSRPAHATHPRARPRRQGDGSHTGGISLKTADYLVGHEGGHVGVGRAVIRGTAAIASSASRGRSPSACSSAATSFARARLPTRRHPHVDERQDDRDHQTPMPGGVLAPFRDALWYAREQGATLSRFDMATLNCAVWRLDAWVRSHRLCLCASPCLALRTVVEAAQTLQAAASYLWPLPRHRQACCRRGPSLTRRMLFTSSTGNPSSFASSMARPGAHRTSQGRRCLLLAR